ncbi:hypothetical protein BDV40DRAFT_261286 [Aspergillus tamarii]|uniref:Uncharacterized protein n=1 Tax=Aspergillus tamarii TaxID=41984 RepID=A0A5N6V093_ASPTM|nr:hypothetical protein BDV40DRAFT_261286 [Aspergillus tamarii]
MFNKIKSPVDNLGANWALILAFFSFITVENPFNLQHIVDSIGWHSQSSRVAA